MPTGKGTSTQSYIRYVNCAAFFARLAEKQLKLSVLLEVIRHMARAKPRVIILDDAHHLDADR